MWELIGRCREGRGRIWTCDGGESRERTQREAWRISFDIMMYDLLYTDSRFEGLVQPWVQLQLGDLERTFERPSGL